VAYSPGAIYLWTVLEKLEPGSFTLETLADVQLRLLLLVFVSAALNLLLSATLTFGVVSELRGQHAPIGQAVTVGLKRFFPVLGVTLLIGAIIIGPAILLGFMAPILLILWIVPALMMYCMYYVAVGASVIEKPGIAGALARSRDLTAGRRGGIFGMLLLLGLIGWGLDKVLQSVFIEETADLAAAIDGFKSYLYANFVVDLLLGTLGGVVAAVTYYLLRSEKEGTSADELAAVFE
jgi:hypothetical protein